MKNKDNLEDNKIIREVESDSENVSDTELGEIVNNENRIREKASKLNFNKFSGLLKQISLALQMIKDYRTKAYMKIPWKTIALVAAAILYFINPFDIVPDFIPFLGYTDDALAFAAVFKAIQTDLYEYCQWKGYDVEDYF